MSHMFSICLLAELKIYHYMANFSRIWDYYLK